MNITYFIGNGFDINIGLKTDYHSFLSWYLEEPSENPVISEFKTLIQEDIETWSDLEFTLGKKTVASPLDEPETFLICKTDLDLHLQKYLKLENDTFPSPPYPEFIPQFRKSLYEFIKYCDPQAQDKLRNIYKQHIKGNHTINIIDFNFTDTVDLLWKKTPYKIHKSVHKKRKRKDDTLLDLLKREITAFDTFYYKGELIHIHGTLDRTMMTGVNDIGQLFNSSIKNNEDILKCCIKPLMNDHSGNNLNERVRNIIGKTDIFIVFGMSIGETDKMWWDEIVHQVISNPHSYLLLINYDSNYRQVLSYTRRYASKSMEDNLFRITQLGTSERLILNSRMSVLFNTNLFKLNECKPYTHFRGGKKRVRETYQFIHAFVEDIWLWL